MDPHQYTMFMLSSMQCYLGNDNKISGQHSHNNGKSSNEHGVEK